jgi:hypothetical protein
MRICSSWVGFVVRPLQAILKPLALFRILDVHVLDADRAAVCVTQHAQDVAQQGGALAPEVRR